MYVFNDNMVLSNAICSKANAYRWFLGLTEFKEMG